MPSKEFDRTLSGMVSTGLSKVKEISSVRIRVQCKDCNGYKGMFDSSSCPHPGAHDGADFDHDIRINLKPALPSEKELPPPVERLDGEPTKRLIPKMKQRDPKLKAPEEHELEAKQEPVTPNKRTDGGKSRRDYVGLRGNDDPFIQAQESNYYSYEPRHDEPTDIEKHKGRGLPTYSLGDKG